MEHSVKMVAYPIDKHLIDSETLEKYLNFVVTNKVKITKELVEKLPSLIKDEIYTKVSPVELKRKDWIIPDGN